MLFWTLPGKLSDAKILECLLKLEHKNVHMQTGNLMPASARDMAAGWNRLQLHWLLHRQSIIALWGISTYFGKQVPLTQVISCFAREYS